LIHATEDALFLRWQELGDGPMDKSERAAMNAAAADLLSISFTNSAGLGEKLATTS
jgi:hypothetical protein